MAPKIVKYLENDFTREIDVSTRDFEESWGPRDIRKFNKLLLSDDPTAIGDDYTFLLEEINKGVATINCNKKNKVKVTKFCDLLNVEIKILA